MSLNNLEAFQIQMEDTDTTLENAQEAVDLYRKLAAANPAADTPDLARSLCVLAITFAAGGYSPQTAEAATEATNLLSTLASKNPSLFGGLFEVANGLQDQPPR